MPMATCSACLQKIRNFFIRTPLACAWILCLDSTYAQAIGLGQSEGSGLFFVYALGSIQVKVRLCTAVG